MSSRQPLWERIFTQQIRHDAECPFVEGDEHGEGHVECECYVSELWDALVEHHEGLKAQLEQVMKAGKRLI